jgi:hypothetical protein
VEQEQNQNVQEVEEVERSCSSQTTLYLPKSLPAAVSESVQVNQVLLSSQTTTSREPELEKATTDAEKKINLENLDDLADEGVYSCSLLDILSKEITVPAQQRRSLFTLICILAAWLHLCCGVSCSST